MADRERRSEAPGQAGATPTAEGAPVVVRKQRGQGRTWVAVLLTVLVAGGAVAFVVVDSLQAAKFYRTVPEVRKEASSLLGQQFRVSGKVVPGSLSNTAPNGVPEYRFLLVDHGQELVVHYARALPDSFTDGVEVVVDGSLQPNGEFVAAELLARCPSKYEAERTPESMAARGQGGAPPPAGGHPSEIPLQANR